MSIIDKVTPSKPWITRSGHAPFQQTSKRPIAWIQQTSIMCDDDSNHAVLKSRQCQSNTETDTHVNISFF